MQERCEICKQNSGTNFPIYYGKVEKTSRRRVAFKTDQITTMYQTHGPIPFIMCNECIVKEKKSELFIAYLFCLISGLYIAFSFKILFPNISFWTEAWDKNLVILLALFFTLLIIMAFSFILMAIIRLVDVFTLFVLRKVPRRWGERIARMKKEKELKAKGFDIIWTSKEYEDFRRKSGGFW